MQLVGLKKKSSGNDRRRSSVAGNITTAKGEKR